MYNPCMIIGTEEVCQSRPKYENDTIEGLDRGSRYNTYVSFVRCIGDLLQVNRKSASRVMCSRWVFERTAFERRDEKKKNKERGDGCREGGDWDRCARLRLSGLARRSIKRESVVRESFCCYRGLGPGRWLFTRDRLLLPVRRIGVPCYRVMSLLFKNHARVTCAAINYNNVI